MKIYSQVWVAVLMSLGLAIGTLAVIILSGIIMVMDNVQRSVF